MFNVVLHLSAGVKEMSMGPPAAGVLVCPTYSLQSQEQISIQIIYNTMLKIMSTDQQTNHPTEPSIHEVARSTGT